MSGTYGGDLTPCDTQYWDEFYAGDAPPFEWYTGAGAVVEVFPDEMPSTVWNSGNEGGM